MMIANLKNFIYKSQTHASARKHGREDLVWISKHFQLSTDQHANPQIVSNVAKQFRSLNIFPGENYR